MPTTERIADTEPALKWRRADTDEPDDQVADSAITLPGVKYGAWWCIGPQADGTWSVELVPGPRLADAADADAAKAAAQAYEDTHA